jgi:hypothetical protein
MMTITFACPGCARRYSVNQALAGKRTKCKQCGHGMTIPAAAAGTAAPSPAFDPYAFDDEPAAPGRAPAAVSESGPGSGYGLASSPGSRSAVAEAEAPVAAPRRAGPVQKKRAKARSSSGVMAGRGGAGLSLGGLAAVAVFVLRIVAIGQGGFGFGLSARSEVERFAEANLAGVQEMTSILGTVHDPASAGGATPRAVAVLDRLVAEARRVKDKKARIRDLDAVKREYEGRMAAAKADLDREMQRVASVPGGMGVILALQAPVQELAALEAGAAVDPGPRHSGL